MERKVFYCLAGGERIKSAGVRRASFQSIMNLYIIAGEKSGDIHGALLLKNLLRLMPGLEVRGLGGGVSLFIMILNNKNIHKIKIEKNEHNVSD